MKFRNTLLAVAVLAGLAAWIYFYEYRGEEGRKKSEDAEKKVFVIETDKVEGLELARPDSTISLRKEGDEWRMTAPLAARADGEEVSGLLSTLSWLEIQQKVSSDAPDLETFKLKDPVLKITVNPGEGKPPIVLHVGDKAPIGSAYYARRGDAPEVVTVSSSLDRLLEATPDKLRYKKIVGLDSWKVARFAVARAGSMVSFSKEGEEWRLESPLAFPAERGKVSNLLYDLTGIAAEGFEPEGTAPASVGLDPPEATLRVEEKEGKSVSVEFSARDASGVVRARRADMPEIFRVKPEILDKLSIRAEEYRDARVAPVDRWTVSEIRAATSEGEKRVLKDAESNWRWESIDGPTLDRKVVDDLLDALDAAKASGFRDGQAAGTAVGSPGTTLTLKAGEAPAVEVRLGAEEAGKVLVSSTAAAAIYELDKALADRLIETARALRAPDPHQGAEAASSSQAGAGEPGDGGAP